MIENLNNFYIYFILNKFFKLLTYFKKSLKKLWSQPGRTQNSNDQRFFWVGRRGHPSVFALLLSFSVSFSLRFPFPHSVIFNKN